MSGIEYLLNALKTGEDVSGFIPQSRQEEILKRICLKQSCDDLVPQSRNEVLLIEAAKAIEEGSSVTITATDDGNGNVTIVVPEEMSTTDDGSGNVTLN